MKTKWRILETPSGKFCITDDNYIGKHCDSKYGLFEELEDLQMSTDTYFIDFFGSLKVLEHLIKLNIPNLPASEKFPTLMQKINQEIDLLKQITGMLVSLKNLYLATEKNLPNFLFIEDGDSSYVTIYYAIKSGDSMIYINESPKMYSKSEAFEWLNVYGKEYFPDILEYVKIETLINGIKELPDTLEKNSLLKLPKYQKN